MGKAERVLKGPVHQQPHGGGQPFESKNSSAKSSPDRCVFPVKTLISPNAHPAFTCLMHLRNLPTPPFAPWTQTTCILFSLPTNSQLTTTPNLKTMSAAVLRARAELMKHMI
jgi:hypothetical protein